MEVDKKSIEQDWGRRQIMQYKELYPKYMLYAETMQKVLEKIAKKFSPQAIVQSRPKAIASFAEKIYRKKGEYNDPVHQFTDLCGGRIITSTRDEVAVISRYIEEHFEIDWINSVDVSQRLKPTEFGYRSIHYIVSFKREVFTDNDVDVAIPEELYGLKAEIQIRTLLEHVWADFNHNIAYKKGHALPKKLERELASLAAVLENADGTLMRIRDGSLKLFANIPGSYMDRDTMLDEKEKLEAVLEYDKENVEIADHIGRLLIGMGDYENAINLLSKYVHLEHQAVLCDLGIALCKLHRDNTRSADYKKGQDYLEKACYLLNDVRALTAYADSWSDIDNDVARELYSNAFSVDPTEPLVICNYLQCEIAFKKEIFTIHQVRSNIFAAIDICRQQIDVGVNIPLAYFNLGKLYLFAGKSYESLMAYAKAIQLCTELDMIVSAYQGLFKLKPVQKQLPGYEWVMRYLLICMANRTDEYKNKVKEFSREKSLDSPVIIVVGGCNAVSKGMIDKYEELVIDALKDFKGTILSSGIKSGISGCIGKLGIEHPGITTIGYLPRLIPVDMYRDKRYSELRYTENEYRYDEINGFCALETLKKWMDITVSGINPYDVKVLGIGGGKLTALEYRIALSLGARVIILEDSGYEAAKLISDAEWKSPNMPISLPNDMMTLSVMFSAGTPITDKVLRDMLGRKIHEIYWDNQFRERISKEGSMNEWDKLLPYLKESNMQQADDIVYKLQRMGFSVKKAVDGARPIVFTSDEVERMAEMEHGRWNAERLLDGWVYGKTRDVTKKISPYLMSWKDLPDGVREWDRQAVREIPGLLAGLGYEIYRAGEAIGPR